MCITETRDLLFEYFIDKIFVSDDTITIASWFFDHGNTITLENLDEAEKAGEVRTLLKEFVTSPSSGAKGIRTPDLFHAMEARYQLRHSPACARRPKL